VASRALPLGRMGTSGLLRQEEIISAGSPQGVSGNFGGKGSKKIQSTSSTTNRTQATYIVNRMRDWGILMSTDAPLHTVLKISPPLVFCEGNTDALVATLDEMLAEDFVMRSLLTSPLRMGGLRWDSSGITACLIRARC